MDSLFGIPTPQLTWYLLIFSCGVALVLTGLAIRDRTSFRMATRNLSRHRAQTALIVAGLTLATVLFSAAFTTGDTLTNSLRAQALEDIGKVDVVVRAQQTAPEDGVAFGPGAGIATAPRARESYFDADLADEIRERLEGDGPTVAGADSAHYEALVCGLDAVYYEGEHPNDALCLVVVARYPDFDFTTAHVLPRPLPDHG